MSSPQLPPLQPDDDGQDDSLAITQPHATLQTGNAPVYLMEDVLNNDVYEQAIPPVTPDIRNSGNVSWAEPYDPLRWTVPERSDIPDWPTFQAGGNVHLGATIMDQTSHTVGANSFSYNTKVYPLTDYKGRPILVPDHRMWGWYSQRKVTQLTLDDGDNALNYQNRVVFGTSSDNYTDYPEKWGFKSRKTVKQEGSWLAKSAKYEANLEKLNPTRHKSAWKGGLRKKWNGSLAPAGRWDEIHEESGLRIKHAPCILMKNQYISTYQNFVASYLDGAMGDARNGVAYSTSGYVTNHEVYRMFSGKYRKRILDNTLFADGNVVILKPQKIHFTANPFKAMTSDLQFKNAISRWYRIKFKSL